MQFIQCTLAVLSFGHVVIFSCDPHGCVCYYGGRLLRVLWFLHSLLGCDTDDCLNIISRHPSASGATLFALLLSTFGGNICESSAQCDYQSSLYFYDNTVSCDIVQVTVREYPVPEYPYQKCYISVFTTMVMAGRCGIAHKLGTRTTWLKTYLSCVKGTSMLAPPCSTLLLCWGWFWAGPFSWFGTSGL